MGTPRLVLVQVLFLMVPEDARPQLLVTPSEAVSTPSGLGTGTLDGLLQSSEGTETPRAGPGISTVRPAVVTPSAPGNRTVDLFPVLPICVCDLTPGACDINCCCDRDCFLLHPRTVFSFCLPGSVKSSSWVCVDNSLIFRSNSPFSSRVFVDSNGIRQFCVHVNDSKLNYFQTLQKVNATNFQALAAQFGGESFISTFEPQWLSPFYRAGDPILTYFTKWSLISLLRQPAGVGAWGLCAESNPAGFLQSKSTTCTRFFKNLTSSCTSDAALDAASYFNFTVLKVPRGMTDLQNMKVPVTLVSQASSPLLSGNVCHNVVSQVMNCTSCCFIPIFLEIQVLWAYIGLQSNPQAHVSGARFLYQCRYIQDPQPVTEVSLTTLVTFVDITQKPEPPRGQPRIDWKLPFDFFFPFKVAFSRGVHSQKDSVSSIVILCLVLLGVFNLETK